LFKHLIPLDVVERLPLPLLRRLRELQRKRLQARQQSMSNSMANAVAQTRQPPDFNSQKNTNIPTNLGMDTTALSELLMDEL
jgi:hypothetical protein